MIGQKTGGRAKGTPNKISRELRETLKIAISGELERLADTLAELPAKERLDVLTRLMPYCLPKVESIGSTYDSALAGWDY